MKRKLASQCDKWEKYFSCDFEDEHKLLLFQFQNYVTSLQLDSRKVTTSVSIDYTHAVSSLLSTVPHLSQLFINQPIYVLNMYALACDKVLFDDKASPKLSVRVFGFDNFTCLKDIKANIIGQLVSLRGNVVRSSSVKSLLRKMAFQCNSCRAEFVHILEDEKYSTPTKCSQIGCRGKSFTPLRDSSYTEAIDWQKIRIQETLIDESGDTGRVPRSIDIELFGDLVDTVLPGDTVFITGIVKYQQVKDRFAQGMHTLYVKAVNASKTLSADDLDLSFEGASKLSIMELDQVDYMAIHEISQEPNLFYLLVHSIAPAIFGHELVKAGLLLALFGGRSRKTNDDAMHIRSDSHVLIVGDPGLGKSQMLSYLVNVAPRGVFVCSNTSTSGGLTVTLSKESGSGEFVLEAGALVLGDQGICCIDELDKMNEYEALLEAMEQQSVSIAKAGITCSLPARTSVIAAANPTGGHYNKSKTVSENLKMKSALLSRFDLIFILLDKPDENMDRFLSEHVMNLHSGKTSKSRKYGVDELRDDGLETLNTKLVSYRREVVDTIPAEILRKYVAYAKKHVHPRMSAEAAMVLQKFYLTLRANYRSLDTAPITTRQLESMIRLAESRAKCELRETVTIQDAEDVVEIMKQSLFETCEDEIGNIEFGRSQMGVGMSRKNDVKIFVSRLQKEYQKSTNDIFTYQQLYNIALELNIKCNDFQGFLDCLNNTNYIIKKGPKLYKLCIQ